MNQNSFFVEVGETEAQLEAAYRSGYAVRVFLEPVNCSFPLGSDLAEAWVDGYDRACEDESMSDNLAIMDR